MVSSLQQLGDMQQHSVIGSMLLVTLVPMNPMNALSKCHVTYFFARDICQPSLVTSASFFVSIPHKLIWNHCNTQFGVLICSLPITTKSETVTYLTAQYQWSKTTLLDELNNNSKIHFMYCLSPWVIIFYSCATNKQPCKRAVCPRTKDIHHGRVPYKPKNPPPFTLQQLMQMRQFCLKTVEVC